LDHDIVVVCLRRELDLASTRRELECVGEKVTHNLAHSILVPPNFRGQTLGPGHVELYAALHRQHTERRLQRVEESSEVELPAFQRAAAGLEAAHVEQTTDQPREIARLRRD